MLFDHFHPSIIFPLTFTQYALNFTTLLLKYTNFLSFYKMISGTHIRFA